MIVRGRIRRRPERFPSTANWIACCGEKAVSVPVPQVELPRFASATTRAARVRAKEAGEGDDQGGQSQRDRPGTAGDQEGRHILEVEVDLGDLADMLGEALVSRTSSRARTREVETEAGRFNAIRANDPTRCAIPAELQERGEADHRERGAWDPSDPRVVPIPDDLRYRASKKTRKPDSFGRRVFHMMDVGPDGARAEGGGPHPGLLDRHLAPPSVQEPRRTSTSSTTQLRGSAHHTFFHLRESGGTKISSAYELCLQGDPGALPARGLQHLLRSTTRMATTGRRATRSAA
ncbi:MAG: hypothetical protein R3F34_18895 [Planctomycetota bacterium]